MQRTLFKTFNTLKNLLSGLQSALKPLVKPLVLAGLIATLVLGHADGAMAARTGGRIGGGSFRAPSRTYSSPRTYAPPSGGYYPAPYPGGGFGFPLLFPFFGIGGGFGSLFTILVFLAIANFLFRAVRGAASGGEIGADGYGNDYSTSSVSVAKIQVGLLAQARELQAEFNELAETADTSSEVGRAQVLQETSLALLRHPEYWVYGAAESHKSALASAEAKFNQLSLAERSKFSSETLSNVNNLLRQAQQPEALTAAGGEIVPAIPENPGEYIVATVIVGALGNLQLPTIHSSEDLQQALRQLGSVGSDRLLAFEVLWTPQAEGDTLSTDDVIANYPNLQLV